MRSRVGQSLAVLILAGLSSAAVSTSGPAAAATGSPSPTAGPTSSPYPSPNCASYSGDLSPTAVTAGQQANLTLTIEGDGNYDHKVFTRPAGYTRDPALRQLEAAEFTTRPGGGLPAPDTGTTQARWASAPTTNSRYWVRIEDQCRDGVYRTIETQRFLVTVAPRLTLTARRHAARDYTFSGQAVSRPGHRIDLYRVTGEGQHVLTGRTTSTPNGTWSVRRTFLGSGNFSFLVRTVADQANAAGSSNARPTVVH